MEDDEGFKPVRRKQKRTHKQPYESQDAKMEDIPTDCVVPGLKPRFEAATPGNEVQLQMRILPVPPHRMTPLRKHWMELVEPTVEKMKLQIKMNLAKRVVMIRSGPKTDDVSALQKGTDFVRAFLLGFEVRDAVALLRLDDLVSCGCFDRSLCSSAAVFGEF
eukprot:Polyplicarium_translucidae@DN1842_c0_g1_i2.p1